MNQCILDAAHVIKMGVIGCSRAITEQTSRSKKAKGIGPRDVLPNGTAARPASLEKLEPLVELTPYNAPLNLNLCTEIFSLIITFLLTFLQGWRIIGNLSDALWETGDS